jgi:uncharacterized protein YlxW (UPF0749 family)
MVKFVALEAIMPSSDRKRTLENKPRDYQAKINNLSEKVKDLETRVYKLESKNSGDSPLWEPKPARRVA